MSKNDHLTELKKTKSELLFIKQQNLLHQFLVKIKELIGEQAEHYLKNIAPEAQRLIVNPQVFFSYAWTDGADLDHLQFFLKQFQDDLQKAGLRVWLDLEFMTGNLDKQMKKNIEKSQYVMFMGTERYAQRTTKLRNYDYDLALVALSADCKIEQQIAKLPSYQKSPILINQDNQLWIYVMEEKAGWKLINKGEFAPPFNELSKFFDDSKPVVLKKTQISQAIYQEMEKYHYRNNVTNVYKELLFALEEEEKRRDHNPDFLLPLLLEGDYGTTFPTLLENLVRDGRSWFSFKTGTWTSYTDYIECVTSYEKSLGILPCLLGLNRRDDYPKFRENCARKYKETRRQLMLELKDLQSPVITTAPKKTTPMAKNRFTLMSNPDIKGLDEKAVMPLLQLVVKGKQTEAEQMIIKTPGLVQISGFVIDLSARKFTKITPFKYAVWSNDWAMSEMILKYLPPEIAISQFNELETKGTEHGARFNITPLINSLQIYIDKAEKVWRYNQYAVQHWSKEVGNNQRLLPISIVNQYCEPDKPFDPCPNFDKDVTLRTDIVKVGMIGNWYTVKSGDGALVGFYRGALKEGAAAAKSVNLKGGEGPPCKDIVALQALWKTRTGQFESLKKDLQELATHRLA
ncbi:MAG: toll/interleukin-1 receptor domain-containing protein [Proteobacteria bacterium]|nr:toll/interleukin-1 receptor domain-containing protein [Pseudomonadota bacterium]